MKEYICAETQVKNCVGAITGTTLWKGNELIRCKDCKYNDDGECIIKAGWFPVKPEWFCADGKSEE